MDNVYRYFFNIEVMQKSLPFLLNGLWLTIGIALLVIVIGLAIGLALAVLRAFQIRALNISIVAFADIFRAIPALVILMLVYFALPSIGITFSSITSVVITLSLVLAAFSLEIFWAGITAVNAGQWEAARSTGLTFTQTLRHVVLGQAIRMVIPPLTNRTIAITKYTAIASAVSVPEILNQASTQQAQLANPTPLTLAAMLYILMFLPLVVLSRYLEHRYGRGRA
jgi:His/Glu/Gln/Arg/opine family amino acid ABC transporter permease subunit